MTDQPIETSNIERPDGDASTTAKPQAEELPLVTILGRPNVGKSTLFNKLAGGRRAIVGDEPGITRDRLYGTCEWQGCHFRLADTGGIIPSDKEIIPVGILRQAQA